MVDALAAVHKLLSDDGLLIDARPDPKRRARIEHLVRGARRVVGEVATTRDRMVDDRAADAAINTVVSRGRFTLIEQGHYWFRVSFEDRAALERYLGGSRRLGSAEWADDAAHRLPAWAKDRFALRRSITYQVLRVRGSAGVRRGP
jgi:hypothetical protein